MKSELIDYKIIWSCQPQPDQPGGIGLPPDTTEEQYYLAWVGQKISELRGICDGVYAAEGLPPISPADFMAVLRDFDCALESLPVATREPTRQALKALYVF